MEFVFKMFTYFFENFRPPFLLPLKITDIHIFSISATRQPPAPASFASLRDHLARGVKSAIKVI